MTLIGGNEFDESRPIYVQIIEEVKKAVLKGELNPGDRLPSVRVLSKKYGVNPNTVQKAFQELEREKFIVIKRGLGSFITEDKTLIEEIRDVFLKRIVNTFIDSIKAVGLDSKDISKIIKKYGKERR